MEGEVSGIVVMSAVIAGFVLIVGGMVVGYLQLRQIHTAVNSNMTTALEKIDELYGKVAGLEGELRHAKATPVRKR